MVTAEAAVAMVSLVVVLGLLLQVFVLVFAQLRVGDAARVAARAAARGEQRAGVVAAAQSSFPGARVHVGVDGDLVTVEVAAEVSLLGSGIGRDVVARASLAREPGVDP